MALTDALGGKIRKGIGKAAALVGAACLFAVSFTQDAAAQSTFTTQSVPDLWTATYVDSAGRTITVRAQPRNDFCVAINQAGYVAAYARSSVAACDRTITFDFETNGFLLQSITFGDMDDLDGTAPRDAYAMNVAGTWTSPTIEVWSLSAPPAFATSINRLINAGAVGTFIANESGENPVNETATFTMATARRTFRMLFDDAQGSRDALTYFDLNNMVIVVAQGTVAAANDAGSVTSTSGGTAIANVRSNDTLNTVAANSGNTTLSVASGSSVPAGLTFNTTTGAVSVAAGTAVGTYSFQYQICELGFTTNCAIATATVTVTGSLDLSIAKTNGTTEVFSGSTTTYTLTVTHNGGAPVNGAVITDTPGAGLSCDAAGPVTITGSGVPSGSYTIADLTGGGIALGTLSSGQSTTLSYSCQVN